MTHSVEQQLQRLSNRTLDSLQPGEGASIERTLSAEDIQWLAMLAGDAGPVQSSSVAVATASRQGVAQGMWATALIGGLLATRFPGPGTVCHQQSLRFHAPLQAGDVLTIKVSVVSRDETTGQVGLACNCHNARQELIIDGELLVSAPAQSMQWARSTLPEIRGASGNDGLQRLLTHVAALEPVKAAVVHSCDVPSLSAALDAQAAGLIIPVLVGPRSRLEAVAAQAGLDISGLRIEDVPHSHAAAARACELACLGEVEALMKGSLHTDELMAAVVSSTSGLRTKRRISHCFVLQTPHYPRPFIVTDAAVNLAPSLEQKADIIRNAIDLARTIGVAVPKVAILAAVETVTPTMPATLDAAALCKMADRGQISGGLLDGPLAFDNAVSMAAARTKGIVSAVAGQADILMVPDLESGNMLAKQLMYLGEASSAGIVLGAKVPVILTSRADPRDARLASCAIGLMLAHRYRATPP